MSELQQPTIKAAVVAFFIEFDFGEGGQRTRLSYRSGARAFLRFIEADPELDPKDPIEGLSSSLSADFKAWLSGAEHHGPGREGSEQKPDDQGYSPASQKLYLAALSRLLKFWWFRGWLSFSPEEESEARKALQVQRRREGPGSSQTRSPQVPADFGPRVIAAAEALHLPTEDEVPDPVARRTARLETLRAQALVHTLAATALRVGDICGLTRGQIQLAERNKGYLVMAMRKTGLQAHLVFGEPALSAIRVYLKERGDDSPFVFIQHGKTGSPGRTRYLSSEGYRERRRGYGARMGTARPPVTPATPSPLACPRSQGPGVLGGPRGGTPGRAGGLARSIVIDLARETGFNPKKEFVSAHAFRHWHAQELIRHPSVPVGSGEGASPDQVQSILGHARAETTKSVYAPEPNVAQILEREAALQEDAGEVDR